MAQKKLAAFGAALSLLAACLPAAHAQTATPPATATPGANPGDNTNVVPTVPAPAAPAPPPAPAAPATPAPPPDTGSANPPPRPRFRIGPAVGVFFPNQSKVRNRFGNTWFSFGVGLGSVGRVTERGTVAADLNFFYNRRGDNHAFFAPLGVGYRIALAPGTNVVPFAGVSANVVFADITSNPENIHNSFQVGAGGSASLGVNFGDSAFVTARYYQLTQIRSFDFSGLSLETGYRF